MLLALLACAASPPPEPPPADWAFVFVVPYDNDLGPFAPAVREAIRQGSAGGVPAFVLEDTPDDDGLTYWTCLGGACEPDPWPELEDSADPQTVRRLLGHVSRQAEARRYGVVVLDHGGRQGELARDEHRGAGRAPGWLSVEDLAAALADFDAAETGAVELLVLQVCAKASLEPLYALRRSARFLLASQLPVRAPNLWPATVLPALARHPDWDGAQVSAAIAAASDPGAYAAYTCARSAGLETLPAALARLEGGASLDAVAGGVYGYAEEAYVDLGVLLDALGQDRRLLEPALCGRFPSPAPPEALTLGYPDPEALSGLSMSLSPDPALAIHAVPGWSAWVDRAVVQRP